MNNENAAKNLEDMLKGTSKSAEQIQKNVNSMNVFLGEAISSGELTDKQRTELTVARADMSNIMKHAKDGNLDALNRIKDRLTNGRSNNR